MLKFWKPGLSMWVAYAITKSLPCRISIPDTPLALAGFATTSMPTPRAITIGSTGSVITACSRMTRLAATDAVHARSARFISFLLFRLPLREGLQDVVGDVAVGRTEVVKMAVQAVGARRLLHL